MYVTDDEIRFEDKNVKARTIPNFFNMWFHSNHNVPFGQDYKANGLGKDYYQVF